MHGSFQIDTHLFLVHGCFWNYLFIYIYYLKKKKLHSFNNCLHFLHFFLSFFSFTFLALLFFFLFYIFCPFSSSFTHIALLFCFLLHFLCDLCHVCAILIRDLWRSTINNVSFACENPLTRCVLLSIFYVSPSVRFACSQRNFSCFPISEVCMQSA